MSDVQHHCLFTAREPFGCNHGTEDEPAVTEKPNALCGGCLKGVQRSVEKAAQTWVELHGAIGDRTAGPSQRVSGTRNPPIPLNVDVAAVMDRLIEWLVVAALRVADVMGMDESVEPESRITAEHARVLQKCRNIIEPNIERLIDTPEDTVTVWRRTGESTTFRDLTGADVAYEIMVAQRFGWRILHPKDGQYYPCPLCHSPKVSRIVRWSSHRAKDVMECGNCGKSWKYDDYQIMCNVALRAVEEERMEQAEQDELARLRERVKLLPDLQERLVAAEAKAERLERGFAAASDPVFADMTAQQFAETVLKESA